MINVAIADDHQIILDGIRSFLKKEKDICCVGELLNGAELIRLLKRKRVDIAIVDIDMPGMNGIEATKEIIKEFPKVKVLVLSMHNDTAHIKELMEVGISGYILKNKGAEELVCAIRKIADGNKFYGDEVINKLHCILKENSNTTDEEQKVKITPREEEVLKLLVDGYSTPEIAKKLSRAESTIETHRRNLIEKFGVDNSKKLIAFIHKTNYLKPDNT